MTSFVHIDYANRHAGADRLESAVESVHLIKRNFFSTHSLATLLLLAIVTAVLVAAYQVMDSMAEGHLVVMWVAVWAVAFAALAIFASTACHAAVSAKLGSHALWAMGQTDADEEGSRLVAATLVKNDWLTLSAARYGTTVPFV